jgi:hypothetical protein
MGATWAYYNASLHRYHADCTVTYPAPAKKKGLKDTGKDKLAEREG